MSDPYGPRDDRTRRAGRPADDRARSAEWAPGNQAVSGDRAPDAWAEIYGRQQPPYPNEAPGSFEPPDSLRGVALAAVALIALTAILEMLNALDLFTRAPQEFDEGWTHYGIGIGNFYTVGEPVHRAATFVLFMAAAALFIAWQYKHAKNAERLGQRGGLGPGWAIGGWFIPLANLVLPVVQLVQSSRASDPPPDRYFRTTSRAGLVVLWAVVFYVSLIELQVVSSDLNTMRTTDVINGVLAMLAIPAAFLAVVVIWQLTKRQEAAFERRAS